MFFLNRSLFRKFKTFIFSNCYVYNAYKGVRGYNNMSKNISSIHEKIKIMEDGIPCIVLPPDIVIISRKPKSRPDSSKKLINFSDLIDDEFFDLDEEGEDLF